MNDVKKAVVVFSGGLDSATLAYKLIDEGYSIRALYLDYGKPCSQREVKAAKLLSLKLGISLEIIDLAGLGSVQKNYSPLGDEDPDELDIGFIGNQFKSSISGRGDGLFISGFHTILSAASYFSQATDSTCIAIAAIKEQFDKIKDLELFFDYFAKSVSILNSAAGEFTIIHPFKNLDKLEVVKEAIRLNVPIEFTWSCVYGEGLQCGTCTQCKARKSAFNKIGKVDPTTYKI
jgi:7-cyano-7-deazaguanine synthase